MVCNILPVNRGEGGGNVGERSGETCPFKKIMASDGTATVKVRTMSSERRGGVVNVWGYGMKTLVFILSWFSRKTAGGRCLEHQR